MGAFRTRFVAAVSAGLVAFAGVLVPVSSAVAVPGTAASEPDGAVLHAVGSVTTIVSEGGDDALSYSLSTDAGRSVAFRGGFDGARRSGVRVDATFSISSALAASAGLGPGDVVEADSEVGGVMLTGAPVFDVVSLVELPAQAAQPVRGSAAAVGPSTVHHVRIAVAMFDQLDQSQASTDATLRSAIDQAFDYWAEGTNGGVAGDVVIDGIQRYFTPLVCGQVDETAFVDEAAQRAGTTRSAYEQSQDGRHLLVILPWTCEDHGSKDRASLGIDARSGGWITMATRYVSYHAVFAHEFGHNLGLMDADVAAMYCDSSVLWIEPTCDIAAQWDIYSPMGREIVHGPNIVDLPALDAAHRAYFGFPTGYAAVHPPGDTATYEIQSITGARPLTTYPKAIRVVEPSSGRIMFIEYRDASGPDTGAFVLMPGAMSDGDWANSCGATVLCKTDGFTFGTGVRVVEAVPGDYGIGGEFLGRTVATPVVTDELLPDLRKMAEQAGEEYVTAEGGVHIRILAIADGVATVEVQSGDSLSPQPAPVLIGKPKVGEMLNAQMGTWGPAPVVTTVEWLRDGAVFDTEMTSYEVQPSDAGHEIKIRVSASKPGYMPITRESRALRIWTLDVFGDPLQNFVSQAFRDFIGVELSADDVASAAEWTNANGRSAYVSLLAASDEWVRAIVNGFYQDTLGRVGEAKGVNFWSNQIATRQMTVATVAAQFYSSAEYFNHIGGGTNASWVSDLYEKLMFRTPSQREVDFWVGQITSGSMNRLQVASFFYGSIEKRRLRVNELYEKILNRTLPTTDSGYAFWADWLSTHDDIDLAVVLATTGNEYFDKAQTPH